MLFGMHGFEIGNCYEALGERDKALAAYLRAAEGCPGIVDNSDIVSHVVALGGIPLRTDREVDVRYFSRPTAGPFSTTCLATDGHKIYVGGRQGLHAFDVAAEKWEPTQLQPTWVTCLKADDRQLFAGTYADGLWRCDLSSGQWTPACDPSQLPDRHVESLALAGSNVYFGAGTAASGGLVQIDGDGKVNVFGESGAPAVAPLYIAVTDGVVLVTVPDAILEWSPETKSWSRPKAESRPRTSPPAPALFAGKTGVWTSTIWGRELARWDWPESENQLFKPTWYDVPGTKAGYAVHFIAEHGDDVWFGGEQWFRFSSSGLYRFNLKTGAFYKFTPADGFKTTAIHAVHDGLWLGDRLWLATDAGLCVVTGKAK